MCPAICCVINLNDDVDFMNNAANYRSVRALSEMEFLCAMAKTLVHSHTHTHTHTHARTHYLNATNISLYSLCIALSVAIAGPGCSETAKPIAGVAKHFNTILISYSAAALALNNRALFPLFLRTVPSISQYM